MYRKNEKHKQAGLFEDHNYFSKRKQKLLEDSWALKFYKEVFCRIEEDLFKCLYTEDFGRPNVPVNILAGLDIIKELKGYTDEELLQKFHFDYQVMYSLGIRKFGSTELGIRTLYYFRKRVAEYFAETGINLTDMLFNEFVSQYIDEYEIDASEQRMDSSMVKSNMKKLSRLQLCVLTLQKFLNSLSDTYLERVPADIRKNGGVARMSDPKMIKEIMDSVSIPVMAKVRIGHFVEAQILEYLDIDYIDESEVLTPADETYHINKKDFKTPFVCGARNLGEALRRIAEGASMIRTKGEAGTGNVVEAVKHIKKINEQIREIQGLSNDQLVVKSKEIQAPLDLIEFVSKNEKLPVVNFAAGGVATPADASLMIQLGADGVFVGSGIFKSGDPKKRAKAIVEAVTHYNDPSILAKVSEDLGEAMVGINIDTLNEDERYAHRGW